MNISSRLLYGNSVSQNTPPGQSAGAKVKLTGTHAGKPSAFTLDSDVLSKQTMLIGGTGCGKTTLFYHFVSQIKRNMTKDDVMIIFDSKGDFYSRFYNKSNDFVIGNSKQYSADSSIGTYTKKSLPTAGETATS
jgi:type IV secretory pathway VirB4 component